MCETREGGSRQKDEGFPLRTWPLFAHLFSLALFFLRSFTRRARPVGKISECVSGMRLVRARHRNGLENKRRGAQGALCDCGVQEGPCIRGPSFIEPSWMPAFFYFLLFSAKSIRPDKRVIRANTEPVHQSPIDFSLPLSLFSFLFLSVSLFCLRRMEVSRIPFQTSGSVESCKFVYALHSIRQSKRVRWREGVGL